MEDRSRSLDDLRSLAPSLSFGLPLLPRSRARSLSRGETTNLNLIRSRLFSARVRSATQLSLSLVVHERERALNLPNGRKTPSSNNFRAFPPSRELARRLLVFTQTLACCREGEGEGEGEVNLKEFRSHSSPRPPPVLPIPPPHLGM